jgi:hypothetical protein
MIINKYALLMQKIEEETFHSERLIDLQKRLTYKKENASVHLKQLANLFSKMDSIGNFVTGLVFNGTFFI